LASVTAPDVMDEADVDMDVTRKADRKGDRVSLGMTGKFLPHACDETPRRPSMAAPLHAARPSAFIAG